MTDNNDVNRNGQSHAYHALATVFVLGFKFLALINGLGVLLVLACSMGAIQTDLSPYLFRMPLVAFLAGLVLCGLGLLWSYLVQTGLFSQLVTGRPRRTHWVPLFCTMVAYSLSLIAFVAGCWFILTLSNLAYQNPDYSQSSDGDDASPSDQSGEPFIFKQEAGSKTVLFARHGTR